MKNSLSKKNIYLKNISEYLVLWAVGGCIYYGIEVLFRGFSHISMFMLGGLCMQFFTWQGRLTEWQDALPRQITRCTIFVVSMEFITGIIVNKWYHLAVWDFRICHCSYGGRFVFPLRLFFLFYVLWVSFCPDICSIGSIENQYHITAFGSVTSSVLIFDKHVAGSDN